MLLISRSVFSEMGFGAESMGRRKLVGDSLTD